jgi:radical S-adenosyl methionine domain-containing protein 2
MPQNNITIPKAVNWHCEAFCNYRCKFCYAGFEQQRLQPKIDLEAGLKIIQDLASQGVEKINFVGGEPMLHPHLDEWIKESKRVGMTTSIVSNGTKMSQEWLESMRPYLDWLGLSVDASNDQIHAIMGRANANEFKNGESGHLGRALEIAKMANKLGYGIKLNTVVTSANVHDDMTDVVKQINPTRWKIFQVLKIDGENDGRVEALLVSEHNFEEYISRHVSSLSSTSIQVVPENNDAMLGTYAMIDALGRVYTNKDGFYFYSEGTVQQNGFAHCWNEVSPGFSLEAFNARGGEWDWENSMGVAL